MPGKLEKRKNCKTIRKYVRGKQQKLELFNIAA